MQDAPIHHVSHGKVRRVSFDKISRNRMHRHSYFEPCIVISGTGEFEHDARRWSLSPGDLFIAGPGVFHEIRSLESKDLQVYFLSFQIATQRPSQAGVSENFIPQSLISSFLARHRTHLSDQAALISFFEYLYERSMQDEAFEEGADFRDASQLLLRHVMSLLTSTAQLSSDDYSERQNKARVLSEIESRLHESIRIADLAFACGMSERTLRRRWRSWSARSLPDEINRRRIERACQLLILPDLAIGEIGFQVGIESPARFSRLFRQIKGLTARDYRKQVMRDTAASLSGRNRRNTEYFDA